MIYWQFLAYFRFTIESCRQSGRDKNASKLNIKQKKNQSDKSGRDARKKNNLI